MSQEALRIRQILRAIERFPSMGDESVLREVEAADLDDCAVLNFGSLDLVVGSDFVRGARFHLFERDVISWGDIGWYVVGANASDLASMGASPVGMTLICRYTKVMTDQDFEELMEGVARACQHFKMPLLGGDTGSFDEVVLSGTAFGVVERGTALLRSGANAGDVLFVTGEVGRAGAAIAYFTRGKPEGVELGLEKEEFLAAAWKRILPPMDQAQALRKAGFCTAAIDTSDGLKAAVRQLGEASGLDAVVEIEKIPVDGVAEEVARRMKVDPVALSVGDSVDFRLVFAIPPDSLSKVEEMFEREGWPLFEIGRLELPKDSPRVWVSRDGERILLPGVEWSQGDSLSIDELREIDGPGGSRRS